MNYLTIQCKNYTLTPKAYFVVGQLAFSVKSIKFKSKYNQ